MIDVDAFVLLLKPFTPPPPSLLSLSPPLCPEEPGFMLAQVLSLHKVGQRLSVAPPPWVCHPSIKSRECRAKARHDGLATWLHVHTQCACLPLPASSHVLSRPLQPCYDIYGVSPKYQQSTCKLKYHSISECELLWLLLAGGRQHGSLSPTQGGVMGTKQTASTEQLASKHTPGI